MIALVIVGIVAAITIPITLHNIWTKAKVERITNIYHKFSKSTDKMLVASGMSGYTNTSDFVNAFKRHMSIAKVCDVDHLAECWGSNTIVLNNEGKEMKVADIKTPSSLRIDSDLDGYKDILGIVTNDGVPMILSYNTKCELESNSPRAWSPLGVSTSMGCISGIFDWNGGKKPNKLGDDVFFFTDSTGIGSECGFEVGSKCFKMAQPTISPISKAECENTKSDLGIKGCSFDPDYWAGGVKECGGADKMISSEDLAKIASEVYGTSVASNARVNATCNQAVAIKYGLTCEKSNWVWTEETNSVDVAHRWFHPTYTYWASGGGGNRGVSYSYGGLFMCSG